jgi:hypothetical protein
MQYPDALDPGLVGTYPASAHAGGGYVWDAVLEYRVWCHPESGAPDLAEEATTTSRSQPTRKPWSSRRVTKAPRSRWH